MLELVRCLVVRKILQVFQAGFAIRYTSIYTIQKYDIYEMNVIRYRFVGYLKRHPWVSFQVAIGMKTATPPRTIDTRTDNLPELAIPVLTWPQVTK